MIFRPVLWCIWILVATSLTFCQSSKPAPKSIYPASKGYVSDFSNLLEREERAELNSLLGIYADSTTTQIFVAILDSLENGHSLNEAAYYIFKEWKPGTAEQDNGVLFLILPKMHVMRFEVGYGLEKVLTDKRCAAILDSLVTPRFRENDYSGGISAAVRQLQEYLNMEWQPKKIEPSQK